MDSARSSATLGWSLAAPSGSGSPRGSNSRTSPAHPGQQPAGFEGEEAAVGALAQRAIEQEETRRVHRPVATFDAGKIGDVEQLGVDVRQAEIIKHAVHDHFDLYGKDLGWSIRLCSSGSPAAAGSAFQPGDYHPRMIHASSLCLSRVLCECGQPPAALDRGRSIILALPPVEDGGAGKRSLAGQTFGPEWPGDGEGPLAVVDVRSWSRREAYLSSFQMSGR